MSALGRGAWTTTGKDNGTADFVYIAGKPLDGSNPTKDFNYQAVNLGVMAIQKTINAAGYMPALVCDGELGPASSAAIKWFQAKNGLLVDGDCGPKTCRALWWSLVGYLERTNNIMGHHLWGIACHESLLDPAAVGYSTPGDRGLVQWNTLDSGFTVQQAHDPQHALTLAAYRIAGVQKLYAGKGPLLQANCSIAQWNSPLWADQWYQTGVAPNTQIATYVKDVLAMANTY